MYQALPCDPKKASGAPIPNSASAASTSALVASATHLSNPTSRLRIRAAYWILGLCNNYGYVIMLSAAHDILSDRFGLSSGTTSGPRECNQLSTGAILLADIIPSLFIKFISPFFPLWIHLRIAAVVALNLSGFLLVAYARSMVVALSGVVAMSIASGLGEVSLLAYTAFFKDKTVITMWSSGTGGAGVLGSSSYLLLTMVLSARDTLLVMNVVPIVMALTFWVLMVHPRIESSGDEAPCHPVSGEKPVIIKVHEDVPVQLYKASFVDRLRDVPPLLKYIVPLTLVYFFEYFINQGLFELIHYKMETLDNAAQYKVFQVVYQVGVFLSRSSGSFFHIEKIWILSMLQGVNVVYFTLEAVYGFSSSLWVVTVIVLWEGLLGGAAYVNTYFCISKEISPEKREFSMAMSSVGDAIGITASGFLAIPAHNALCSLPKYSPW